MIEAPRIAFAFPGALDLPTGGYVYDRRVIAGLRESGCHVVECALPANFPWPDEAALAESARRLGALEADALIIDGLALGALPATALAAIAPPIVALVHHPLYLETGLTPAQSAMLRASEQAALQCAAAVVVTSARTGAIVRAMTSRDMFVAAPGVDPAPRAQVLRESGARVRLLAVGAVSPRKGYDILLQALARVAGAWRLTIVGARDRAPDHAAMLETLAAPLGARVAFAGALDGAALSAAYAQADLFVHPAYLEGYGMAIAEAVAHGLPIFASAEAAAAGAAEGAGLMTAPAGDVAAWAALLARAVDDAPLCAELAARSWRAAQGQIRWADTAAKIFDVIEHVRRHERF